MLSRWPTNPFGIVPSAPTATLVLTFHSFPNSLTRSWYLAIFSFSFSSTLASPGTAMLNNLANCLLFVCYNQVRSIVVKLGISLHAKIPKDFHFLGLSSFQGHAHTTCQQLPICTYVPHRHQWTPFATPSCLTLYSLWANAEHSQTMWLIDSWALLHNLHFELAACLSIFACYCIGSKCLVLRRC